MEIACSHFVFLLVDSLLMSTQEKTWQYNFQFVRAVPRGTHDWRFRNKGEKKMMRQQTSIEVAIQQSQSGIAVKRHTPISNISEARIIWDVWCIYQLINYTIKIAIRVGYMRTCIWYSVIGLESRSAWKRLQQCEMRWFHGGFSPSAQHHHRHPWRVYCCFPAKRALTPSSAAPSWSWHAVNRLPAYLSSPENQLSSQGEEIDMVVNINQSVILLLNHS